MDEVANILKELEIVLKAYRYSLKNKEDKPGETARQYAKEASQDNKLQLSIKQGLHSLRILASGLPPGDRTIVLQKRQALKLEYYGLIHHNLSD